MLGIQHAHSHTQRDQTMQYQDHIISPSKRVYQQPIQNLAYGNYPSNKQERLD